MAKQQPAGKTHNVQVPGETSTSNPAQDQGDEHGTGQALTLADAGLAGEKQPETPEAPPVRRYADMRADEVDAVTLTAPVLTRDGWVCPNPPQTKKA